MKLFGDGDIEIQNCKAWSQSTARIVCIRYQQWWLTQSPEMRDITQPMCSAVTTAFEDSNTTGSTFTGLFR